MVRVLVGLFSSFIFMLYHHAARNAGCEKVEKKKLNLNSTNVTVLKYPSHWLRSKSTAAPRSPHAFYYLRVTVYSSRT